MSKKMNYALSSSSLLMILFFTYASVEAQTLDTADNASMAESMDSAAQAFEKMKAQYRAASPMVISNGQSYAISTYPIMHRRKPLLPGRSRQALSPPHLNSRRKHQVIRIYSKLKIVLAHAEGWFSLFGET
jgi:hypothetical protein